MQKIISAKDTEFEQNGKDLVLIDTEQRNARPIMIDSAALNCGFTNAEAPVRSTITIDDFTLQDKDVVVRSEEPLVINKDESYDGLGTVTITPDTSAIIKPYLERSY